MFFLVFSPVYIRFSFIQRVIRLLNIFAVPSTVICCVNTRQIPIFLYATVEMEHFAWIHCVEASDNH